MKYFFSIIFFLLLISGIGAQGKPEVDFNVDFDTDLDFAQVQSVRIEKTSPGTYTFHVTVRHNDQGWDHYADRWQVVDADTGDIITERILAHPHDNEQPFTRSKSGIIIPEGTIRVIVRAKCSQHEYKGMQISIDLDTQNGNSNEIEVKQ
jgi:hypothetical protein